MGAAFRWIGTALAGALLGLLFWRRRSGTTITASEAATDLSPTRVTLAEGDKGEGHQPGDRCGTTQELARKVRHGRFTAIADRGTPTSVKPGGDS